MTHLHAQWKIGWKPVSKVFQLRQMFRPKSGGQLNRPHANSVVQGLH
ncbi:Uncharacterised protein [Vibrio cholerae]|uniref:Uncharacterized protein n=1 Tax=Vibrio cholerae TaxID=666 RepID=A0A655S2S1_VIBCL|nr:Uncharacterised protein [Vibrio cholerae]CSB16755.1 Uncharacterised protein [Vibrio cholerae]